MDTDIYTQLQSLPSTQSTAADLSQEFSPLRPKHKDSILFPFSCGSSQNFKHSQDDTPREPSKKAIFKIIRDARPSQQTITVPLHKDFGNYNRKEKSLGELSKRLLMMFGRVDHCVISLDTVTNQLGVERRRIYDIINILESLGVVFRKGKNSYQWKGLKSIYETIKKLQHEHLEKSAASTQMTLEFDSQVKVEELDDEDEDDENSNGFDKDLSGAKREKSLGLLSTGFINLFLSWKGTISLEQAGRKMSNENIEENKIKTKIRRLYDIANVFSSLGLIKKTCLESKKPAYTWIGLSGLDLFIERLNSCTDEKEIFIEPAADKPKEQPRFMTEKKVYEKQYIQMHATKTAPKLDQNFQPIINNDTLENLLCTLLNLYKMQQPGTASQEELISALQSKTALFQTPKATKQISSPVQITPSIKSSVPILQRADSEISSEKQKPIISKGFSLYSKNDEISNGKRGGSQVLDAFEKTTLKRLHSFDDIEDTKHSTTKSLNFLNNENCLSAANVQSQP